MKKKTLIWTISILAVLSFGMFIFNMNSASSYETIDNFEEKITIYKSQTCGCCGIYSSYFKNKGNSDTEVIDIQDLNSLKKQYGVPAAMNSCHTTVVGDYIVEGHVPLEAVEKLLKEKPDIKGIAMPGMPTGSPGMPGPKQGDFIVYAVNHDGSYEEFMRI